MLLIEIDRNRNVEIDIQPNECPYCHKSIDPLLMEKNYQVQFLELIFKCPSLSCRRLFIAKYISYNNYTYSFQNINIGELKTTSFSSEIVSVSPNFIKIYNESYFAEQHNLTEICGVGYRKALEYLIKDYLIAQDSSKKDSIKKKFLGTCIKDDVTDPKIKLVAERAVWLGNDEAHYTKLWEDQNINDLKKLISLTLHWIEMEELTKSFGKQMPPQK